MGSTVCRRSFLTALGAGSAAPGLRCGTALGAAGEGPASSYRGFEDLYRQKWTWDRVARRTHGTNWAGTSPVREVTHCR